MTATPHNGKDEDFHVFLALLDGDRFQGKYRDGVHTADPSDLMRRLVKEDLRRFDGTPLFPERCSYTVSYELSGPEAHLYAEVTDYVRQEMNRAERFAQEGEGKRKVNVGFALMMLQRRLASSPEAIFRSIKRRKERLESRLRQERLVLRGGSELNRFEDDLTPQNGSRGNLTIRVEKGRLECRRRGTAQSRSYGSYGRLRWSWPEARRSRMPAAS